MPTIDRLSPNNTHARTAAVNGSRSTITLTVGADVVRIGQHLAVGEHDARPGPPPVSDAHY